MENSNKRNCENCRYYLKHYIKSDTGLRRVEFGHCSHGRAGYNKFKLRENCDYWEPIGTRNSERDKKLKDYLRGLARRLDAVCDVLLDDD